jgi:hypothetical protein
MGGAERYGDDSVVACETRQQREAVEPRIEEIRAPSRKPCARAPRARFLRGRMEMSLGCEGT